jgi:hypothetical protein
MPSILRAAVVIALSTAAVGVGAATAAPKASCNLVTDPAGDATGFVVTGLPLPNDATLDILSGDIASNAKVVTGVLRMAAMGSDSTAPLGRTYYLNFTINGTKVFLSAVLDADGAATFKAGDFTGTNSGRKTIGEVSGVVDVAKKEIRITASTKTWPDTIKPGTKLGGLNPLAQRYFGTSTTGGATPTADDATSEAVYTGGAPSCVVPGK